MSGSPEFTVDGDQIKTTAFPTNFEPPGPAYTFTIRVVDQGSLPTPSTGSLTKTFTVVVTDIIEAPSAEDATFAINENVAAGTFVGNYGNKVTLGDAELTFDIVGLQGNSARQQYTYTALSVNAADGKATMTLNSASSTGEVIKTGDKLQVWDDSTKQNLLKINGVNGNKVSVMDDEITFKVGTSSTMTTEWEPDDILFLDTTGCTGGGSSVTNDQVRMKVNGPKIILSVDVQTNTVKVRAFGLPEGIDCTGGVVFMVQRAHVETKNIAQLNGVFTVTSVIGNQVEYSTGVSEALTPPSGVTFAGKAYVLAFEMEDCSGILTVSSDAVNFEYKNTYLLEVQVRTEQTINTAVVTVTVGNVDEAPYFKSLPSDLTVNECDGASCVGTFEIKLDDNGNTYMMDDPEGQSDFTLEVLNDAGNRNGAGVTTWEIVNTAPRKLRRITSAVLDFETKSSYTLKIVAKDNNDPINLRAQKDITITLINVNEAPEFSYISFSISEEKVNPFVINSVAMSVSDPEGASTTTLKILWAESVVETNKNGNAVTMGDGETPFAWQDQATDPAAASGEKILIVSGLGPEGIDFERIKLYTLVMQACDGSPGRCTTAPFTKVDISVLDANEKPSWLAASSYTFYVNEDDAEGKVLVSASGAEVGSLAQYVSDPDASSSHTFVIDVDSDGTGSSVGGWLTTEAVLNSEIGKPLRINIAASAISGAAPDFERAPLRVVSGSTPASGSATAPAAYKINVRVVDNGGLFADAPQLIEIRIVDSNEQPSFVINTRSIAENSNIDDMPCAEGSCDDSEPDTKYLIVDDDIVDCVSGSCTSQTATLVIMSGNTGNAFKLSALTGVTEFFQMKVKTAVINYENIPVYFLAIKITDVGGIGGGGLTSTGTIQIDVNDINGNENIFIFLHLSLFSSILYVLTSVAFIFISCSDSPTLADFSVSILETAVEGDCVSPSLFSADDEDLPAQDLTYVLSQYESTTYTAGVFGALSHSDNRQGKVCIADLGGSTNQLQTSGYNRASGRSGASGSCANCVFDFTITVTDNGTPLESSTAKLTLSIGDVNAVPTFTSGVCATSRSLAENTLPSSLGFGATLTAQDADGIDQLTFTAVTTSEGKFNVMPTIRTGSGAGFYVFETQLKNLQSLDYETGTNSYVVRIRVSDNKGEKKNFF